MVDQANSKLQQSLSALVDNEATELELHRLLKAMETDGELRASWQHFQLSGQAIKGELPALTPFDLSASISAAIADEPVYGRPAVSFIARTLKATGRLAVAASVAGAVVIGAQQYLVSDAEMMASVQVESGSSAAGLVPAGFPSPDLTTRAVNVSDGPAYGAAAADRTTMVYVPNRQQQQLQNQAIEEHLNTLMLEHAANASRNGGQGLLPYARIAPVSEQPVQALNDNLERD